jgi:predicted aconitase with swiveling domain
MMLQGKSIVPGNVEGEIIISERPISFLGDIDPKNGKIVAEGHPLKGMTIRDKIFAFPNGRGSTVGSYIIYQMKKNGVGPKALINRRAEAIVAVGAIISEIPMVSQIRIEDLKQGLNVKVNAKQGIIEY